MTTKLVKDGSYPLEYIKAVNGSKTLLSKGTATFSDTYWLSQPRRQDDATWEVLTFSFRTAVSIQEVAFEIRQVSSNYQLWYWDRSGNRRQVLDRNFTQFGGAVSGGIISGWYHFSHLIFPIVATKVEFRIQRQRDIQVADSTLVSMGLRRFTMTRIVNERKDAIRPFENDVDPLGNLISKTVKDWDPQKAVDGNSSTFWKSAANPDPSAVANFYLDCRDDAGNGQKIDRIFLNPVYSGQILNMYWSNDDTVGTRRLGNTTLAPTTSINAAIEAPHGIDMNTSNSLYVLPSNPVGLHPNKSMWCAGSYEPYFNSNAPQSSVDLVIFAMGPQGSPTLKIVLDPSMRFNFQFGILSLISPSLAFPYETQLRWSCGIARPSDSPGLAPGLYAQVWNASGGVLYSGFLPIDNPLPLDPAPNFFIKDVEGFINSFIVKQSPPYPGDINPFMQDPSLYLSPDPSVEDSQGRLPANTLDNAVLGGDFTVKPNPQAGWVQNTLPFAGLDKEFFAEKLWTPIWRDWILQKGYFYFPLPIKMKYLNLEISNLTEEPYPIYRSGVTYKYQTFPVTITSTQKKTSIDYAGKSVNNRTGSTTTIDPMTINAAYRDHDVIYPQDTDVSVGTGVIDRVPHLFDTPVIKSIKKETTSSVVFRGKQTDVVQIAKNVAYTVVKGDWLIKIAARYNIDWKSIYYANKNLIDHDPYVKLLPKRGPGWWIFPGQVFKVPTSIMERITKTQTVTERKDSTQTRKRFTTTCVHTYDIRTVTRDAGIAYFTGLKEVRVYRVSYITTVNTPQYVVHEYDDVDFDLNNITANPDTNASYLTGLLGSVSQATLTSAPSFGTLVTQTAHAAAESAGGSKNAMLELNWASYETADGVYSSAYITSIQAQLAAFQAAGMQVTLAMGVHHPPAWALAMANSKQIDQTGAVTGQIDTIFNKLIRAKVEAYYTKIDADLGVENFWAIRLTSGGNAEMLHPGGNSYWAFGPNAQNGTNMPTTMDPNPFPGWHPGDSTTLTTAQVRTWATWYVDALVDVTDWQMQYFAGLGFRGYFQTLTPGSGRRPSVFTSDVNNFLPNSTTGVGAVWDIYYANLRNRTKVIVYISSVADGSGTNPDDFTQSGDNGLALTSTTMNAWSATRWQTRIAHQYSMLVGGENPGYTTSGSAHYKDTSSAGLMAKSMAQVKGCGLFVFYWAHDDRLWDGTSQAFANYAAYIAEINGAVTGPIVNVFPNPDCISGGTAFGTSNTTVTMGSTDYAANGVGSAKVTVGGSPTTSTFGYPAVASGDSVENGHTRYTAAVGDTFDILFTVKAHASNAASVNILPKVVGYHWNGTANVASSGGETNGTAILLAPGAVAVVAQRLTVATPPTDPVDGVLIIPHIRSGSNVASPPVAAAVIYLDRMAAVRNSPRPLATTDWFDGATSGGTWTGGGAANAASSTLNLTSAPVGTGSIISKIWPSMSVYQRISMQTIDRGLTRPIDGLDNVMPVGLTGSVATASWADPQTHWNDTTDTWGASIPLMAVGFNSSLTFGGRTAAEVDRAGGVPGDAGIISDVALLYSGARVRLGIQIYRPNITDNSTTANPPTTSDNIYRLQMVNRDSSDAVVFEEFIDPGLAQWTEVVTQFHAIGSTYNNAAVRLIIDGTTADQLYVSSLYLEYTNIVYSVSNNGGTNYYEVTNIVNQDTGYFSFPSLNNQLRVKVLLQQPTDFSYGVVITPLYIR